MGLIGCDCEDRVGDSVEIAQDVICRETKHAIAKTLENSLTHCILSHRVVVCRTVNFDNQPSAHTSEVDHVAAHRVLSLKVVSSRLERSESCPQDSLDTAPVAAQLASELDHAARIRWCEADENPVVKR